MEDLKPTIVVALGCHDSFTMPRGMYHAPSGISPLLMERLASIVLHSKIGMAYPEYHIRFLAEGLRSVFVENAPCMSAERELEIATEIHQIVTDVFDELQGRSPDDLRRMAGDYGLKGVVA